MMRVFAAVLCVIALSLSAFATELDKKQTKALEKAAKSLAKTEGKLEAFEGDKRYTDQSGVSLERALAAVEKKLARVEVPEDGPGVAEIRARIAKARERAAALVQAKGTLGAKSGLDHKSAKAINYLANTIQNLTNELSRDGALTDRNKPRFQRQIGEVKEGLAKFPADNVVVKGLLEKARAVEARLGGLENARAAEKKAAAETDARIQGMLDHPSYAKDTQRIAALVKVWKERYLWDLNGRYLGTPWDTSSYEQAREAARQWTAQHKEWQGYCEKYAELAESRRRGTHGVWPLKSDSSYLQQYSAAIAVFLASGPGQVSTAAAQARALAKKAVSEKDHRAFSGWNSDIRSKLARTQRIAELLILLGGPDHRGVGKTLETQLAEEEEKLAEVIVAENRAPKEAYTGEDATLLRSFVVQQWSKHFPKEEVLSVRFPSETLSRTVAWRWDSGRKQHYKVDHSDMWIRVLVKQGEEAVIYRAIVRRLHLEKDRLILRWERPSRISPSSRMLVKNID
jgi:hypothetical protein